MILTLLIFSFLY